MGFARITEPFLLAAHSHGIRAYLVGLNYNPAYPGSFSVFLYPNRFDKSDSEVDNGRHSNNYGRF